MTLILGVDPGATGALALINHNHYLIGLWDMPVIDGRVSGAQLDHIIGSFEIDHAWVEDVHAMPRQGVSSTFKFGVAFGVALGVIEARRIPLTRVTPGAWKRTAALLKAKDKGASRRRATELWPAHADAFARVKDDGRAEAALIARHGLNRHLQETTP